MVAVATVQQGALTVTRQITWQAGSSIVNINETVSASEALGVGSKNSAPGGNDLFIFEESGKGLKLRSANKPQMRPPGGRSSPSGAPKMKITICSDKPVMRPPVPCLVVPAPPYDQHTIAKMRLLVQLTSAPD